MAIWARLNFRISAGDTTLSDHLNSAARNATYTSPDIQNQLINILGDQICGMILRKVCNSPGFALIADEVTDCSNKEYLCIVLWYVDPEPMLSESILFHSWNVTVALLDKRWQTR